MINMMTGAAKWMMMMKQTFKLHWRHSINHTKYPAPQLWLTWASEVKKLWIEQNHGDSKGTPEETKHKAHDRNNIAGTTPIAECSTSVPYIHVSSLHETCHNGTAATS